jgi:hypothetical protein
MHRQKLVIRVRFEPSRMAESNLRTAFEKVVPIRRRALCPPAQRAAARPVIELARKEKAQ